MAFTLGFSKIFFKKNPYKKFIKNGCVPWTEGYDAYKWTQIEKCINISKLQPFKQKHLPRNFGYRVDERIVEYPWFFSQVQNYTSKILDAGSTFNHKIIIDHPLLKVKDLTIYTFYPEHINFLDRKISYCFGDLRDLPFKNDHFDEVASISTIEHIGMDNSMYGYSSKMKSDNLKNYSFLDAIKEYNRVLKKGGKLYLTFPYGAYENHGFFQQFDLEMTKVLEDLLSSRGQIMETNFFKYTSQGWEFALQHECNDLQAFNPHSQVGRGDDMAAHSRGICCITFKKNK